MRGEEAATRAFAALLDRSLAQITEATRDARSFDRRVVVETADVWDNNTFPLFRVMTAGTASRRERRAREALAWMAALGPARRAWMIEQGETAGHPVEALLPAAGRTETSACRRDYHGVVRSRPEALTADAAAALRLDYDLAGAEVRAIAVERAGTRLGGRLALAVTRRFPTGDAGLERALLRISLGGVSDVCFDSADATGAAVRVDGDGIRVELGSSGTLAAASGSVYCDDPDWHLSVAGRAADRRTPPGGGSPKSAPSLRHRQRNRPDATAHVAGSLLRAAMVEMRTVRASESSGFAAARDLSRGLQGAGTSVMAAGAQRAKADRRAAFQELIETWIRRCPESGPVFARPLAELGWKRVQESFDV